MNLTFGKCPRTPIFPKTRFSQVNDVRLIMYAVYVITKNGLHLFHWELNCFALKMDSNWKSGIMRRTLWFVRFHINWLVKHSCTYTYIHMWLVCIHSWGNWVVLVHWPLLFKVVKYIIQTWSKIFIEPVYFEILSWMVCYE